MRSATLFLRFKWCALAAALPLVVALPARAADVSGEQIYAAKCVSCHGAQGEGNSKQKRRLEGDRSVNQLAELIGKTMPEDDPGSLSAQESAAVAAYIHDTFYSAVARERNRPARIELARLTVRQYRQAVSDVVGSFRGSVKWDDARGLNGEYFGGRGFGRRDTATKRVDALVNFNFGTDAPVPEIKEPHEFSIRWNGSVLAPATGEYEFVVRTEHALRLWVNDLKQPLIDAWVKSGKETEYKANLHLLGGRVYGLRLEFSKAKQGVNDSKKQKEAPPSLPASIALLWKPPHSVLEPISAGRLSPNGAPEMFVCATAFPPDDRSYGWERGTTVSKEWDQATTSAAIEVAGYVVGRLNEFANTRNDDKDRPQKLRKFCRTFVERAFRRPLTATEAAILIDKQFPPTVDPELAAKRCLVLALKSPRFLYREVDGKGDAYDVAARLSFGLWDSIPDQELWNAAASGSLTTREQVAKHTERMLGDLRSRSKLHEFLLKWLKADAAIDLAKDPQKFPDFDAAAIADLKASLELFLDDVLWSPESDFRQLLLADEVYLNERLAKFYSMELPSGADFTKVKLDSGTRSGVLTHPYLMATFAHSSESSPIHRGVFLARGVLGQSLKPPPEAVAPLAAELHPTLTTRERVDMQTQAASCMTCHGVINPLGFALEHFDAVGRFRTLDRDKPVNAAGSYRTRAGATIQVNGARELAQFLAGSDEAHSAFTEQLFHHLVQQPARAYGPATLDDLRTRFAANGFHIRKLAVDILATAALKGRDVQITAVGISKGQTD